jgi:putative flippase GtrA
MHDRTLIRQVTSFGAVGICATLTHVTIAWFAAASMGSHYLVANLLGALAAFFVSFLGNALLTFRSARPLSHSAPRYVVVTLTGYALASAIMAVVERLGWPGYVYAALVLCIVPPTNLALAKLWVFAPEGQEP